MQINNPEELLKSHFSRSFNLNCTYSVFDTSIEEKLSEDHLKKLIEQYGDLNRPRDAPNNYNTFLLARDNISREWFEENVDKNLINSGYFWYPPNGYCGWHLSLIHI